jgi:protein MAK11
VFGLVTMINEIEAEGKSQGASSKILLKLLACSYEGSLFGWDVKEDTAECGLVTDLSVGFNLCQSSLKAIAVSQGGRYLACGGSDERVRIFNISENRSVGEVSGSNGAITALKFFGDTFLFSGAEVYLDFFAWHCIANLPQDGTISIWRTHDWVCVHILGGHKAAVNEIGAPVF